MTATLRQGSLAATLLFLLAGSAAQAAERDSPCYVRATPIRHRPTAGLHIDQVRIEGSTWRHYVGRYRDSSFVLENAACEMTWTRQLIAIVPEAADAVARLEALRRAFNLEAGTLTPAQKAELLNRGVLELRRGDVVVTYDYKAIGLIYVVSLTIETPV